MTIHHARLEDVGSGLAPVAPGWFVVNASDAAWLRHEAFGHRCVFESTRRVLAERPDAARAHGAGVEDETPSPHEAYARFGHWRLGRPDPSGVPWGGPRPIAS